MGFTQWYFIINFIAYQVQTTCSAGRKFSLSKDGSGYYYNGVDDEDDNDGGNEALPALMTHHCTFTTETAPPFRAWVDVVVERFTPDSGTEPHDVKYVKTATELHVHDVKCVETARIS